MELHLYGRLHRKAEVTVASNCTAAFNYMSEHSQIGVHIVSNLPRLDSLGLVVWSCIYMVDCMKTFLSVIHSLGLTLYQTYGCMD